MTVKDGFAAAAEKTGEYGCNAMQIFTKSPQGGVAKPIKEDDAAAFKKNCERYAIRFAVAHSSYLLNFGKPMSEAPWMLENLSLDFERIFFLGGHGVVVHVGKALERHHDDAIGHVVKNAKTVIEKTQHAPGLYIIENTAGQGSEVGSTMEELAQIWKGLKGFSPRVKFCLDTAHLWGAGYDLSDEKGVEKLFMEFDEAIGLKQLACIHFNDSAKEKGSRVDRHDNLGEGMIGIKGLKAVVDSAMGKSIPLILETPEKDGKTHLQDIEKVRSWLK